MTVLLAALLLQVSQPAAPTREKASKDDCEILVAVGNAGNLWGPTMFNVFDGKDGKPGYEEVCDWRALGATSVPTIYVPGSEQPRSGFFITRPTYDAHGTHAHVATNFYIKGEKGQFMIGVAYELEKVDGRWKIIEQHQMFIT